MIEQQKIRMELRGCNIVEETGMWRLVIAPHWPQDFKEHRMLVLISEWKSQKVQTKLAPN